MKRKFLNNLKTNIVFIKSRFVYVESGEWKKTWRERIMNEIKKERKKEKGWRKFS